MRIIIPHAMRKLSFQKKDKFLVDSLAIPQSEIRRIRCIRDLEKRMIEAAKIQWETFQDIHGDVTAWLSGFPHESKIRSVVGSHFYLRDKLGLLAKSEYTDIEFSEDDLRRRIELPREITAELSEETGIHIGDGSLWKDISGYCYVISGDSREELLYHKDFISPLIEGLYKVKPRIRIVSTKTECRTILKSKAIAQFKYRFLGLPLGEKCSLISIPAKIISSGFSKECLRGIFDTDGHLTMCKDGHVSLSIFTVSEKLLLDIREILTKFRFKFGELKSRSQITLHKESTIRFLDEIGLHSIKHWSKFLLWKEFGFSPLRTHTEERLAAIKGEIPFEELVKISEKRKTSVSASR